MSETTKRPKDVIAEAEPEVVTESFILCELAGATYALPSSAIEHLEMVGAITPVPNAPHFVEGVVSARGRVIPVVNLRSRFGFERQPLDVRARLIVVRSGGRSVGLLVDSAREFASIGSAAIQPPPEEMAAISGAYLEGIAHLGERLVLLLRIAPLLDIDVASEESSMPTVPGDASASEE